MTQQQAQTIFDTTNITDQDTCGWILECHELAKRLAILQAGNSDEYSVRFLCERHKRMGMWTEGWQLG